MKLNKDGKLELRKAVDTKLNDVEFDPNHRIKIKDKERLEEILFDIKFDEKGNKYKEFAFVGNNMCKLDLSEVDMSNVSFNSKFPRDLSNTNIKIDFKESYEYKYEKEFKVYNIDFKNVDLSNNEFDEIFTDCYTIKFANCDLTGTSIDKAITSNSPDSEFEFIHCDLSKIDFTGMDLNLIGCDSMQQIVLQDSNEFWTFTGCNMSETNIKIFHSSLPLDESVKTALSASINRKLFEKCTFVEVSKNGERSEYTIKTKAQKAAAKKKSLTAYAKYKAQIIDETLTMIESELKTSKGGRQIKTLVLEDNPKKKGKNYKYKCNIDDED